MSRTLLLRPICFRHCSCFVACLTVSPNWLVGILSKQAKSEKLSNITELAHDLIPSHIADILLRNQAGNNSIMPLFLPRPHVPRCKERHLQRLMTARDFSQ